VESPDRRGLGNQVEAISCSRDMDVQGCCGAKGRNTLTRKIWFKDCLTRQRWRILETMTYMYSIGKNSFKFLVAAHGYNLAMLQHTFSLNLETISNMKAPNVDIETTWQM